MDKKYFANIVTYPPIYGINQIFFCIYTWVVKIKQIWEEFYFQAPYRHQRLSAIILREGFVQYLTFILVLSWKYLV